MTCKCESDNNHCMFYACQLGIYQMGLWLKENGHKLSVVKFLYEIIHICTAVVDESEMWSSQ